MCNSFRQDPFPLQTSGKRRRGTRNGIRRTHPPDTGEVVLNNKKIGRRSIYFRNGRIRTGV